MKRFDTNWTDEIAEISTLPEFQNSTVEILDPSLRGEYDIITGEWTYPDENPVVYSGRARVKGIRWGVFYGGESQANAKTVTSIRVQLPKNSLGPIKKGASIVVLSSEDNPQLEETQFTITSGFQGSAQAARTLEASLDGDAAPGGEFDE